RIDKYRGLLPFGITISKDERTLYVALLGFNAIAVIDVASGNTKGLVPTGWGPARVLLSKDQKELYVISCRGYGAGPNGGANFIAPPQGTYIGDIQLATFQKIPMPDEKQLKAYTKNVLENTFIEATAQQGIIPVLPGKSKTPIKHVVYITKENRTYDEVMGQLKTGKGDSTLARFGNKVNIYSKKDSALNVDVMPNHLKLAVEFSFSDNFYCDSDASIHGHHWMMGVIPNEWVETNSSADASFNPFSKAPGRRFPRSTGSMDPEDYAEIGGLWEALERNNISFYNFGQANETGSVRENWDDTLTGASHGVMVPMQNALYTRTSRNYAGYNTNIPDQFRVEQFEKEFTEKWLSGKDSMPGFITIQLPNDHGAAPRPEDGYPYQHSYMADNDLALGRMISFLSSTPYWKNMLVIITEDDPQGGVDHLDAHRSVLMMAGPYVKRNYTSHTHGNFGSILKLIYNILGINYVNQYDITASLLNDFFVEVPDYAPYRLVIPDAKVFDADKAMKKYDRTIDWKKIKQGPKMDHVPDMKNDHYDGQEK
ncbi:MAG: bifunctional YncE family protein/alkaline phosphatase family protein, partial [Flavitalea sp.]